MSPTNVNLGYVNKRDSLQKRRRPARRGARAASTSATRPSECAVGPQWDCIASGGGEVSTGARFRLQPCARALVLRRRAVARASAAPAQGGAVGGRKARVSGAPARTQLTAKPSRSPASPHSSPDPSASRGPRTL